MELLLEYLDNIRPLSEPLKDRIKENFIVRTYPKQAILAKAGKINNKLFFILKGLVRFWYYSRSGKQVSHCFMSEGQIFAPAISYYKRLPTEENIQALEHLEVIEIFFTDLERIYTDFPEFEHHGRIMSMEFSLFYYNLSKLLREEKVEDRLAIQLETSPMLVKRITNKILASYLKTNPYYLSVVLKRFYRRR